MYIQIIPLIRYLKSYIYYYLAFVLSTIIFLYTELILVPVTQNVQFQRDDPRIAKSFVPNELVGNTLCLIISVALPLIVIAGYCTVGKSSLKKPAVVDGRWPSNRPEWLPKELHLLHVSAMCILLTAAVNGALTCSLKLLIGNPRPDFLARCQLDPETTSKTFTLDQCRQQNKYLLYDGLRSSPSGHSSFAASGLVFLFLWQTQFTRGHYARHSWCLLLALVVMISRIIDHKHFWYDVVSGALVGLASLFVCWQSTYPHKTKKQPRDFELPGPVTI